jgi:hypothetical protein
MTTYQTGYRHRATIAAFKNLRAKRERQQPTLVADTAARRELQAWNIESSFFSSGIKLFCYRNS